MYPLSQLCQGTRSATKPEAVLACFELLHTAGADIQCADYGDVEPLHYIAW